MSEIPRSYVPCVSSGVRYPGLIHVIGYPASRYPGAEGVGFTCSGDGFMRNEGEFAHQRAGGGLQQRHVAGLHDAGQAARQLQRDVHKLRVQHICPRAGGEQNSGQSAWEMAKSTRRV
eukprot:4060286-Pyramimonas_sp.AAC.1